MINIKTADKEYELEFNNIKIINTENTTQLYKELFLDSSIFIDNKRIKQEDIIYINDLTKLSEFVSMGRKSFIFEMILDLLSDNQIINHEIVSKIINSINNELDCELLESCEGDINKIISLLIELTEDKYLNKKFLQLIIEKQFTESKLIVLDNVSWFDIDLSYKYLNEHSFILLTNDFRKYIKNTKMIEIVANWNDLEFIELNDSDKLIAYLEKQVSEPITHNRFQEFLSNRNSLWSIRLFSLIKSI